MHPDRDDPHAERRAARPGTATVDPGAWAEWISEDLVQRLFALRQDLAEVPLQADYRTDLRTELSVIITELRTLATELRSGASVHDRPPAELVDILRAVSTSLRDRPALRDAAARVPHPGTPTRPPSPGASGTGRRPLDPPPRALQLHIEDEALVDALRTAGRPLSALELRAALGLDRGIPPHHLTQALRDAVDRGVVERFGQRRGTRYDLPDFPGEE